MQANGETSLWAWQAAYLLQDRTKADQVVMPLVFSTALTVVIDFSVKPSFQSFFCNSSKDPAALSHPFQLILNPMPHPLPLRHPISTPHLSFICGTGLFSFPAPFKTVSPVSTFPTDCALTLQKSKGVLSVLIIHVRWEALASLHCKLRKKGFYSKRMYVCVCVCPLTTVAFCVSVTLYSKHKFWIFIILVWPKVN